MLFAKPYSRSYNCAVQIMSSSERDLEGSDDSRRKIIIGAAVVAALFIAIIFYFLMRASSGGNVEPVLEGALRPGSPEFDQNIAKLYLDPPEADWMGLESREFGRFSSPCQHSGILPPARSNRAPSRYRAR